MNYDKYTIEDFALDPNFRKWILGKDKALNDFWSHWISENPDQADKLKEARKLVLNLPEVKHRISDERVSGLWEKVNQSAKSGIESRSEERVVSLNSRSALYSATRRKRSSRHWMRAAVYLFLCSSAALLFLLNNDNRSLEEPAPELVQKQNPWGQKSTLFLEDGSEVILNAGSELSYYKNFEKDKRLIYLTGEAYFKVAKDTARPFIVITEGLQTRVLGTEFNVKAYRGESVKVALVEGSVEINAADSVRFTLMPGEACSYVSQTAAIDKYIFNAKELIAWKDGLLYFEEADESEVFRKLEQWYGVKIMKKNNSGKPWAYTGEFHRQSLKDVLVSIGYAMKFKYEINNDIITISYG